MSSYLSTAESNPWSIDSPANGPSGTGSKGSERKQQRAGEQSAVQFDTVIGNHCHLSGNFLFQGRCQLDCIVEGEVSAKGDLYLGESAEVKATIHGERVYVLGRLIGEVVCSERLELFAGARVSGNITSPRLVVHDGVVFDGYCRMGEQPGIQQLVSTQESSG